MASRSSADESAAGVLVVFPNNTLGAAEVAWQESAPSHPVLDCPTQLSITLAPGSCEAAVDPTTLDVARGACWRSTSLALTPTSSVTPETSSLQVEAINAWGRTASCDIPLSVVDDEAPVVSCDALPSIDGAALPAQLTAAATDCSNLITTGTGPHQGSGGEAGGGGGGTGGAGLEGPFITIAVTDDSGRAIVVRGLRGNDTIDASASTLPVAIFGDERMRA